MNCARPSRPGFASIVALMMIALVGGAILAVTSLLAADLRRTQNEARDTQLRQLVIAGAQQAREQTAQRLRLELPESLQDAEVVVQIEPTGQAVVTARLGGRTVMQTIERPR